MNDELTSSFEKRGLLYLKGFLPKKLTRLAKESVESELERLKIKSGNKKLQSLPFFQQTNQLSKMLQIESEVQKLFTPELHIVMESLVPIKSAPIRPQLLLSLPHKEKWSLKSLNWHLDLEVPKKNECPGIQAFILIDDVVPKGGATLAIAGSHQLHYADKKGSAHGALRANKVFSQLYSQENGNEEELLKTHLVNGIETSIVEMSGQAGDVYLMDLRVLHSPSINSTKNFRMMATNRFFRRA